MAEKSFRQAISEGLRAEMQRDDRVFLIGTDISGGAGCPGQDVDAAGGVLGITKGFASDFGVDRVIDTPIAEMGYMGIAAGAAATGMRPVAELMFNDFVGSCFDVLLNQVPKFHYMFGGKAVTPLTVRTMIGAGASAAAQHSQSLHHIFTSIPGLKVVVPSNAYDAKGLLIQAIQDDDPVMFMEHKALYDLPSAAAEVPDEAYTIPFGEANFLQEGDDVTIIAMGLMAHVAMGAAVELAKQGITCDVIDPRTTSPLDEESILESVESTGRLVVVDEGAARCGFAHDVAALVAQHAFASLKSPIKLVTPPHCPTPFSSPLEQAWLPGGEQIVAAALDVMGIDAAASAVA
ncbi:alpha-ketoacid dehydrogenase subunit beta [Pseudoteredinibacter isoporae]|uniref:Pyruvate dehydrogenase E1 component beta subunit n=1 Tax=Pseudoteredinibacter isoporae TaxID=570281 RepID=A0A7X0JT92_9GAMM|nr:alpha-ketoacid dehydrogenase subunit beta [Pseudoteredinibacter isoporae]MBB6521020.1 pyruvate dehydrogenase E1 component beta subunit [Pseudoteredinibacter isoporae]NHO86585.1 alpha-ketoacid dehydrogenase subunit beta [Pseudoteredinibacter isoporae]NIB24963.1 alpha-ketoacid dehydrogenase subunit beta [Pseudoteredinibacter isoporae]